MSQLTSWLDGSVVYGSTEEDLRHLRLFKSGKLRYHNLLNRKALLPRLHHPHEGECIVSSPRLFCFAAGDVRCLEFILTLMKSLKPGNMQYIFLKIYNKNPEILKNMQLKPEKMKNNADTFFYFIRMYDAESKFK
jgi:hypothetical protein